jgi:hypothetical protein
MSTPFAGQTVREYGFEDYGEHMRRKITPPQRKGCRHPNRLTEGSHYVALWFLIFLIGLASVASFVGIIIAAFVFPILCVPMTGTFALTLRLAYGIIQMLLRLDGS